MEKALNGAQKTLINFEVTGIISLRINQQKRQKSLRSNSEGTPTPISIGNSYNQPLYPYNQMI
jgi:hypothetical protein